MRCQIKLKPHMAGGEVLCMDVTLLLDGISRKAGEELFKAQVSTVTIPGCVPEDVAIADAMGTLDFTISESKPYPYHFMHYAVSRDLAGEVCLSYKVKPRPYAEGDCCGPYFDLKAEDGGASSAGLSFLPEIDGGEGDVTLLWDLSDCPEGSSGVCTFGEGMVQYQGHLDKLRQSYFIFGQVQSITQGDFGFYWLTKPTFDV